MGHFLALALLVFSGCAVASCLLQLPCDHFLRAYEAYSDYFQHCICEYGNWTKYFPENVTAEKVPVSQCASGLRVEGIEFQPIISHGCSDGAECEECPRRERVVHTCVSDCCYKFGSSVPTEDAETRQVPHEQCKTSQAALVEQELIAVDGYKCNETHQCRKCQNKTVLQYMCTPTMGDVLPEQMGLGQEGQNTTHILSPSTFKRHIRNRRQESTPKCTNEVLDCPQSNREVRRSVHQDKRRSSVKPLPVNPLAYDPVIKQTARYRRNSHSEYCQQPNSTRHILFILDGSGSVLRHNFENVVNTLSNLIRHFCRPVKVAAMTFSHNHYSEFCFDCFDNSMPGREAAATAMSNIPYHTGLTHSGIATTCACNKLLNAACGFHNSEVTCLDVIYVTDGHSNDPGPVTNDVCQAVGCLHVIENVVTNVYAFGVADINYDELKCITQRERATNHLFLFQNFTEFQTEMDDVLRLMAPICFGPNKDGGIGMKQ
jgi:hypothetical protein